MLKSPFILGASFAAFLPFAANAGSILECHGGIQTIQKGRSFSSPWPVVMTVELDEDSLSGCYSGSINGGAQGKSDFDNCVSLVVENHQYILSSESENRDYRSTNMIINRFNGQLDYKKIKLLGPLKLEWHWKLLCERVAEFDSTRKF